MVWQLVTPGGNLTKIYLVGWHFNSLIKVLRLITLHLLYVADSVLELLGREHDYYY